MLHPGPSAASSSNASCCSGIAVGVIARLTSDRSASVRMLQSRRAEDVSIQMPSTWAIWVLGVSFMRWSLLPLRARDTERLHAIPMKTLIPF